MIFKILERGPWKRDLAIAVGSAFVVTFATKFGEGLGETLSEIAREKLAGKKKPVKGAKKPEKAEGNHPASTTPTNDSKGLTAHHRPSGWEHFMPASIGRSGMVIRDDGKVFWSKGIVFGHKVTAIDLTTMQTFEEAEERFKLLPEGHPLTLPSWSEWKEVEDNVPDGVLVAQSFWDAGPQFFGVVHRKDGKLQIKPTKVWRELHESQEETLFSPKGFRIVPPVLAAKLEIDF
jgi:hypothetical protein